MAEVTWDAETLRALEERLDRAAAAAERLLGEAARGAAAQDTAAPEDDGAVPRNGWQRRGEGAAGPRDRFGGWLDAGEGELLMTVLAGLRDRIPPELQARLAAAVHEVLLAVRALIEWCLERAQRRRAAPVTVQDIPIL